MVVVEFVVMVLLMVMIMAFETRSYCISGWPETYNVVQFGLKPASALWSDRINKHAPSYVAPMLDFSCVLLIASWFNIFSSSM